MAFAICISAASLTRVSAYADFEEGLEAYNNGDYARALAEMKSSAEQGHAGAQCNLGFMYGNGEGVAQDYAYAYMWFNIASSNGNDQSVASRDSVRDKLTSKQIEQSQEMARDFLNSGYVGC